MPSKPQYDNNDRGVFGRNDKKTSPNAPSHKGKLTLSEETLRGLSRMFKDGQEPVIYFSGWPTQRPAC